MIKCNDNVWYLGIYKAKVLEILDAKDNGAEVIDLYKIFVQEPINKILIAYPEDLKPRTI